VTIERPTVDLNCPELADFDSLVVSCVNNNNNTK
jgi:hypothetical protein